MRKCIMALLVGLLLMVVKAAHAVDYTWAGGAAGAWTNAASWTGGSGGTPFDTAAQADTATITNDAAISDVPNAVSVSDVTDAVMLGTVVIGNGVDAAVVTLSHGSTPCWTMFTATAAT